MKRNLSSRAWRLKRNGLIALAGGAAWFALLLCMLLGSQFTFTVGHVVVTVLSGGFLATAVLCLHLGFKVEEQAKEETKALEAAARKAEHQLRVGQAAERRTRREEQLPLEEWDTAITNTPRPQPAASPRPELLRPTPWRDLVPGRDPVDANQHNAT